MRQTQELYSFSLAKRALSPFLQLIFWYFLIGPESGRESFLVSPPLTSCEFHSSQSLRRSVESARSATRRGGQGTSP